MKVFRYKTGHLACKTVTVEELRARLAEYPGEMAVLIEWEGQAVGIDPARWEMRMGDFGWAQDRCATLFIDANP